MYVVCQSFVMIRSGVDGIDSKKINICKTDAVAI